MTGYRPREIGKVVVDALKSMPVVVLSGMRQTGKSTLLLNQPQIAYRKYLTFDDFGTLEAARRKSRRTHNWWSSHVTHRWRRKNVLNSWRSSKQDGRIGKRQPEESFLFKRFSLIFAFKKAWLKVLAGRARVFDVTPFYPPGKSRVPTEKQLPARSFSLLIKRVFPKRDTTPMPSWNEILTWVECPRLCLGEAQGSGYLVSRLWSKPIWNGIFGLWSPRVADLVSVRNRVTALPPLKEQPGCWSKVNWRVMPN